MYEVHTEYDITSDPHAVALGSPESLLRGLFST